MVALKEISSAAQHARGQFDDAFGDQFLWRPAFGGKETKTRSLSRKSKGEGPPKLPDEILNLLQDELMRNGRGSGYKLWSVGEKIESRRTGNEIEIKNG